MTITHSRGSNEFGDGWDRIFSGKKSAAGKTEPKQSAKKTGAKKAAVKKAAKKKAAKKK